MAKYGMSGKILKENSKSKKRKEKEKNRQNNFYNLDVGDILFISLLP